MYTYASMFGWFKYVIVQIMLLKVKTDFVAVFVHSIEFDTDLATRTWIVSCTKDYT